MRVLFVVADLYFSEPLGAMILSAVCKKAGHSTSLAVLRQDSVDEILEQFQPDVVAYSTMTPDEDLFADAAKAVRRWSNNNKLVVQVMGGPHPTFFPEVIEKLKLDAICIGDGERAILAIIDAVKEGREIKNIPNVSTKNAPVLQKEVVEDMNAVPFADRALMYDHSPELLAHGIRSFLTQKGCPYKCTYCFNHAFNRMFKGEGRKILRRRSVDDLIEEIKAVKAEYPKMKFVRFADDVFVINKDDWLEEFSERYPKEIGIPFYCLIRANSLTEEVAQFLNKAGCRSLSMSIEAGTAEIRNDILKRNMPDEMMEKSFALARKYKLNAFANTILAVPGTTYEDDYQSVMFARKLNPSCPTFSIFSPFPGTDLTKYAVDLGVLSENFDYNSVTSWGYSILENYSDEDRIKQANLNFLGQIMCKLPDFMMPFMNFLIKLPLTRLYRFVGSGFVTYILATRIFPGGQPNSPVALAKAVIRALRYMIVHNNKDEKQGRSGMRAPAQGLANAESKVLDSVNAK